MRVINLLLACLVSIGNCQQVQSFVAPEKALADILLANTPGAAFQVPVNTPAGSRLFNAPASAQAIHQQRVDEPSMSSSGYWQKFWSGGLRAVREQQEKEWWLSEWRFALYMDRYYNSSYAYNAKPSAIGWDNFWGTNFYTAPDVAFRKGVKQLQRVAANPWRTLYPGAIDNDPTGTKSFAPGQNSLDARYFKPPERASLDRTRIVNPDGFTVFGQQRSTDLARKRDSKIKEIKRRLAGIKQKNRPYKPRPGYKTLAEVAIEQAARKGNRRSSPTMSAADADRICENYDMQAQKMKADVAQWFEKNPQGLAVLKLKPYEVDMLVDTPETLARRAARCRDVVMKPQSNFVADMQRRTIMNLLTLGAVSVPVGWILFIFISYFIPPNEGGAGGAVTALDAVGGAITFEGWLKDNLPETRKLVQGIRGDATYLIVNKDRKIEDFGVNAVCTHLGCVVPWNRAQNKFMCPCHGSQYDYSGKVVRGPAPLSLALAHVVDTGNGKVSFTPWTEQDFRTGQDPWWKP